MLICRLPYRARVPDMTMRLRLWLVLSELECFDHVERQLIAEPTSSGDNTAAGLPDLVPGAAEICSYPPIERLDFRPFTAATPVLIRLGTPIISDSYKPYPKFNPV